MNHELHEDWMQNFTFDELSVGQGATIVRTLTDADIAGFAAVSGDFNPTHLDDEYARGEGLSGKTAHGMWSGAMVSTMLGTVFPGPGTLYIEQRMRFLAAARAGDRLEISVHVKTLDPATREVTLDCVVRRQGGPDLMVGEAIVKAPAKKQRVPRANGLRWHVFDAAAGVQRLLDSAISLDRLRCAIVHPCDVESLRGALEAARHGLFTPVIVAPKERLFAVAHEGELDLSGIEIVDVPHSHAAAERAAELAALDQVQALMKGSLHTDELMTAVLARRELRTKRRLSHVFRFDVPMYHKPLLITDAALNIEPTLDEKVDIVQNAIDFARVLGCVQPKVAVLAAVETVNARMVCTIDAAALCKMAERGQITGGLIDGPLAFDNAISVEAARIKKINSPVAGDPDILMVPDLVSGNILAKQLEYLGGAMGSGIVLGARVPIALTSRADGATARLASAALAVLVAHHDRKR
ncbi:MAG: bifunctional enoyl-CoA hydratase/phosphate acetyltransferase [Ideonella sp.]|nr:bifunctional enoyl-CoA hydratase/phosphate acetyltransferase [Ideonella sp.]MBL0148887.1 bifunctional enoyl-CoA hydratase/phosphate acetyltransferase [Ideonella sp.]